MKSSYAVLTYILYISILACIYIDLALTRSDYVQILGAVELLVLGLVDGRGRLTARPRRGGGCAIIGFLRRVDSVSEGVWR